MHSQNAQTLHFSGIEIDKKQLAQEERVTNDDDRHRIRSARKHTPEVPGFCPSMGAVGLTVTASGSEPPRRCLATTSPFQTLPPLFASVRHGIASTKVGLALAICLGRDG